MSAFLRLEDFATGNGPDVHVSAAAPDAPAGDFRKDYVISATEGQCWLADYAFPAAERALSR